MLEVEYEALKKMIESEREDEQIYLISLFRRLTSLHPNIRRWIEKNISDGELHMEMPEHIRSNERIEGVKIS